MMKVGWHGGIVTAPQGQAACTLCGLPGQNTGNLGFQPCPTHSHLLVLSLPRPQQSHHPLAPLSSHLTMPWPLSATSFLSLARFGELHLPPLRCHDEA